MLCHNCQNFRDRYLKIGYIVKITNFLILMHVYWFSLGTDWCLLSYCLLRSCQLLSLQPFLLLPDLLISVLWSYCSFRVSHSAVSRLLSGIKNSGAFLCLNYIFPTLLSVLSATLNCANFGLMLVEPSSLLAYHCLLWCVMLFSYFPLNLYWSALCGSQRCLLHILILSSMSVSKKKKKKRYFRNLRKTTSCIYLSISYLFLIVSFLFLI